NSVSVGEVGGERQITNVAAGTEGTDAVNLEQLNAASDGALLAGRFFKATGDSDAIVQGEDATAAGSNAMADGDYATAIGASSSAYGMGASAFGSGAMAADPQSVAVGFNSAANGEGAVAVGGMGQAYDEYNSPMVDEDGNPVLVAAQAEQNGTAVGAGALATGVNASAIGNGAQALGNDSFAGGMKSRATGDWTTAIGSNAWASGGDATAVGAYAWATANGATAFGTSAWATATNASAFGYGAWADTAGATALGMDTWASGVSAVAVGRGALSVDDYAIAIGATSLADGVNAIALGRGTLSLADNAMAMGMRATVGASATNGVAVGANSFAEAADSVALGSGSHADRANSISVGASAAWTDEYGVVHEANQRQITNVAAGSEDTDAVNLAQLNAVADGLGDLSENAVVYDGADKATLSLAGENGTLVTNVAAGEISATSTDAINGGQLHAASSSLADALGGGASVTAFGAMTAPNYRIQGSNYFNVGDALAALDGKVTDLDGRINTIETKPNPPAGGGSDRVQVGGDQPASIGTDTNAVAVGSDAAANGENGVAVGGGAYAHGPNDTAIGGNARVDADGSTAVGANTTITAAATNAVAVGEGSSVSAASGTALGQGASVTAEGAVALGQGSVADRANTVSVGSAGNERQITNVAAGTQATDAANYGQVQTVAAEAKAYTDNTATQTLSSANAYTDQKFATWNDSFETFKGDVDRRFYDTDRRIDRQGAMGAAMLNMATSAAGIRTQNRVGVGVGFQGGESALSVGYQRAMSDRATLTVGGAFSGDEKSVGVGAGFGW
ncbi:MAG: YadA-like family protein, partial [Luteimonas sp.]